jgi:competence protein ComEA
MTLPGIGEAKAAGIIEYRKSVGEFQDIEDVKNVSGIGDAVFEKIKDRIEL